MVPPHGRKVSGIEQLSFATHVINKVPRRYKSMPCGILCSYFATYRQTLQLQ